MVPASLYQFIYLFLIAIMTFIVYGKYKNRDGLYYYESYYSDYIAIVLVIFMSIFIGLRPLNGYYFGDMGNYALFYNTFYDGVPFSFKPKIENILFENLFAWWGSVRLGYTSFFLLISTLYFVTAYLGIRKLFPNDSLAAYLVFLAAFSTFSYATNGIKAGVATSIFIWAIAYRNNLKICIPLILISWGIHHSMIMPVGAFITTMFFRNTKMYFVFWAFCLLMAIAHVTAFAHFFAGATTEHGASYLLGDGTNDGTKGGFRFDFILYSAMPVLVGWSAVIKKKLELSDIYIYIY